MTSEKKSLSQRFNEWGDEKATWKTYTAGGLVLAAVLGLLGPAACNRIQDNADAKAPKEYIEHRGLINGYNVRIDETKQGRRSSKGVHVSAVAKDAVPYWVTGHDYNGDGIWDRFFIQTTSRDGCNSAIFKKDGTWDYEPCPADKGKVPRFTEEEITRARKLLEESITAIYDDVHLIRKDEKGRYTIAEREEEKKKEAAKPKVEAKAEVLQGPKLEPPAEPKTKIEAKQVYETSKPNLVQRNCDLIMDNSLNHTPNAPLEKRSLTTIAPAPKKVSKLEITLFYPTRELKFRKNLQMPIEACLNGVNPHALTVDNYAQFGSGADNVKTSAGVFKKKLDEKGLLQKNDNNSFYFEGDAQIPVRILTYEME